MYIKNLLFLLIIFYIIQPVPVSAETAINSNTSVVSSALARVSEFSITPTFAGQNQSIEFSITVENNGNILISATPVINISDSANNTITSITFTSVNISVGNNATIITNWNTNGNPIGTYKAVAVVNYNNLATPPAEETFDIQPASSQRFSQPSFSSPSEVSLRDARISFVKYPMIKEMMPGENGTIDILVLNSGRINISQLSFDIRDIPEGWIEFRTKEMELNSGDIKGINLAFSIPADAKPGNYMVTLVLKMGIYEASTFFLLNIKPYSVEPQKPVVMREVVNDAKKSMSSVIITVKNTNRFINRLEVVEEIPKDIASDAAQIKFGVSNWDVIEPDPVIRWTLENMNSHETAIITYEVPGTLEEYSTYLNWPVKQLNIFYNVTLQEVKISQLEISTLSQGKNGKLSVTVSNRRRTPLNATLNMILPSGWKMEPESIAYQFRPASDEVIDFTVSSPESAAPGMYSIPLKMYYDDKSATKDIFIYVVESHSNGLPSTYLLLSVLSIIVLILILTLKDLYKNRE